MIKTGEWISEAWALVKEDLWMHVLLMLVLSVGSSLTGGIIQGPLMAGYMWIIFKKLSDASYKPAVGDIGKGASAVYEYGIDSIMSTVDRAMPLEEAIARSAECLVDAAERACRMIRIGMKITGRIHGLQLFILENIEQFSGLDLKEVNVTVGSISKPTKKERRWLRSLMGDEKE